MLGANEKIAQQARVALSTFRIGLVPLTAIKRHLRIHTRPTKYPEAKLMWQCTVFAYVY
jgi:hypothetical protein